MSSTLSFARPQLGMPARGHLTTHLPGTRVLERDGGFLVYRPGASARGVVMRVADDVMTLRLLAFASDADYALAYDLAKLLAKLSPVAVEGAGEHPATELATRLADWQLRDRAMAIAAAREGLAGGATVEITGPCGSIELGSEADLAAAEARLVAAAAKDLGALAIVVGDGAARGYAGDAFACLRNGPAAAAGGIAKRLQPIAIAPASIDVGFLIDATTKTLIAIGGPVPDWEGWTLTAVTEPIAFEAYLGERLIGLPRERPRDGDPRVDAVLAALAPGVTEHETWLYIDEDKLEEAPREGSRWWWLSLIVLAVCLPLRVLCLPLRGAARRARERRASARVDDLRARLAQVAEPRSPDDRINRAVYLAALGWPEEADLELSRCLADGESTALALWNRGVIRAQRHKRRHAWRDRKAALAAGYVPPKKQRDWRALRQFFLGV